MNCSEALISMAIVAHNEKNPYYAFCETIKYCLFSVSSKSMSIIDLRNAVSKECGGLFFPLNVALKCLDILKLKGEVSVNHNVKLTSNYDCGDYERVKEEYRSMELFLVHSLVEYVKEFGKEWGEEYAREQLIKVIDQRNLASSLFLKTNTNCSDIENVEDTLNNQENDYSLDQDENDFIEQDNNQNNSSNEMFRDSLFVGKFIEKTINGETILKDYLLKICEGLMICAGTFQLTNKASSSGKDLVKGTPFFFDTRLLLRLLGCAGKAAVESTEELVKMIQEKGGIIYYYPHTLEEMTKAFDEAINQLKKGYPPHDNEMRLYCSSNNLQYTTLQAKKASIQAELSKKSIEKRDIQTYDEKERITFGFDYDDLKTFMIKMLPDWHLTTIENDALSIWETHMRRRGDYSVFFGSANHLPVFVTSNTMLPFTALKFCRQRACIQSVAKWKANALPIITDVRLTCRLWDPSSDGERLTFLYLSANAMAAQRPTKKYFESICSLVTQLQKEVPEYSSISLPAFFDDAFTELVLEKANGSLESISIDTLSSSLNEFVELKTMDLQNQINKKDETIKEQKEQIRDYSEGIIKDGINDNKNQIWMQLFFLHLIKGWSLVVSIFIIGISAVLGYFVNKYCWTVAIAALVSIIVQILEKVLSSPFVEKKLMQRFFSRIEASIDKRIRKKLTDSEKKFENAIINGVKQQHRVIIYCRKMLDDQ